MGFDLDRKLEIETPEQVVLCLPIAGVGSRMAAYGVDLLLRLALSVLVAVPAIFVALRYPGLGGYALAGVLVSSFILHFGYYLYFEVVHSGQTPGKRRMGLRTVKLNGAPVDFTASALRNILRVVDWLPGFYGLGVIVMFCSTLEQRLGDLTAGTVVVREGPAGGTPAELARLAADYAEICRELQFPHPERIRPNLSGEEVEALARLLDRLPSLDQDRAKALMQCLVQRLRGKALDPDGTLAAYFDNQATWELALRFLLGRHLEETSRSSLTRSGPT